MANRQALDNDRADQDLAHRLVSGGDARIQIDGASGANQYGCRPVPDPRIAPFGSSTASTISHGAHVAAQALRSRLTIGDHRDRRQAHEQFERVRGELISLCGLGDIGPEVIFAASGTDIHLLAACLFAADASATPLVSIVPGLSETGSGVPAALALQHFSSTTAAGARVTRETRLSGLAPPELVPVPMRDAGGLLRPADQVDADVESCARRAQASGRKVLLTLLDVSKTGVIAPSPACARRLKQEMPDTIDVLVDACQFRLSGPSLAAYLREGFLVAITGSKFLTGPTFSGALLIPQAAAGRLRTRKVTPDAALYGAQAEWPSTWAATADLPDTANHGLLLRWEAALAELRLFQALPPAHVRRFFERFADAVQAKLAADPVFEPLQLAPLNRGLHAGGADWDQVPTIFPFLLRHSAPRTLRGPFARDDTCKAHALLRTSLTGALKPDRAAALQVEFGQPVACGERDAVPVSALRICSSARVAVQALSGGDLAAEALIAKAMLALDKTALIARAISRRIL